MGSEASSITKDPSSKNSIAVIDRTILTVKNDIAADIADDGGYWNEKLDGATKAFNARPNSYSTVPPDDVLESKVADFKILQKNRPSVRYKQQPDYFTSKAAERIRSLQNLYAEPTVIQPTILGHSLQAEKDCQR